MKGIVFRELIEMVEQDLGLEVADQMITNANTSNGGAYTSIGTYDHNELIRMVVSLSQATDLPTSDLVRVFGRHLFVRFRELYPQFFVGATSAVDFLPRLETYIHVEVRKLYPDAELPTFQSEWEGELLRMTYRSTRPFADLAEGLILACLDHFQDAIHVSREDLGQQDGCEACFTLAPATAPADSPVSQTCLT